jgi:hypothetical protein
MNFTPRGHYKLAHWSLKRKTYYIQNFKSKRSDAADPAENGTAEAKERI